MICIECGRNVKLLANHKRMAHSEEGRKTIALGNAARRGVGSWNSGKTASDDPRIQKLATDNSLRMTGKPGTKHSEGTKKRISKTTSELAKLGKFGGYRQGSGRGKKGWYKGYWCNPYWIM